ncbi:unnamed protein product [Miscanthus lutarioriparius]|uniref:Protein kinase domain-containing protein n=1 Tax=Miscanthus lutarioriparius TaxID=422564 RepID=A0A811QDW5_9POAL|nr:unnamed protein product [Miscanthus lutarioriparius]
MEEPRLAKAADVERALASRPPDRAAREGAPGVRAPVGRLPCPKVAGGQPQGGAVDGGGLRGEALHRRRRRGHRGRAAHLRGAPERGAVPLMTKDLASHVKEVNNAKRSVTFPLAVVVDVMLQIARGMEYLHSRKIYHGDLNQSNVLVRTRHSDAPLHIKVAGFGQSTATVAAANPRPSPRASVKAANAINAVVAASNPCI